MTRSERGLVNYAKEKELEGNTLAAEIRNSSPNDPSADYQARQKCADFTRVMTGYTLSPENSPVHIGRLRALSAGMQRLQGQGVDTTKCMQALSENNSTKLGQAIRELKLTNAQRAELTIAMTDAEYAVDLARTLKTNAQLYPSNALSDSPVGPPVQTRREGPQREEAEQKKQEKQRQREREEAQRREEQQKKSAENKPDVSAPQRRVEEPSPGTGQKSPAKTSTQPTLPQPGPKAEMETGMVVNELSRLNDLATTIGQNRNRDGDKKPNASAAQAIKGMQEILAAANESGLASPLQQRANKRISHQLESIKNDPNRLAAFQEKMDEIKLTGGRSVTNILNDPDATSKDKYTATFVALHVGTGLINEKHMSALEKEAGKQYEAQSTMAQNLLKSGTNPELLAVLGQLGGSLREAGLVQAQQPGGKQKSAGLQV